tara:strand:- start:18881 stop:19033 length:153 start_codon:yes stop_codon:yes gene_type:complete
MTDLNILESTVDLMNRRMTHIKLNKLTLEDDEIKHIIEDIKLLAKQIQLL